MSSGVALVILIVLLAGNAFFVGAEFALVAVRRDQLEPRAADGSRSARITLRTIERLSTVMAGAQFGITACSLGIGAVGEPAVAHLLERPFEALGLPGPLLHGVAFTIALVIVVYLHMVMGEMVPKNIALVDPTRAALVLGPPMHVFCRVTGPLLAAMTAIANGVVRLFGVRPQEEVTSSYTREEVRAFVSESGREGLLDEDELGLLTGALDFETLVAADVVLDPAAVRSAPADATVGALERLCAETGFSRFPLTDADGQMTGYVHLKDLLERAPDEHLDALPEGYVWPLIDVPRDAQLRRVVALMQRSHAHLARTTTADGRVGLIALEDVLEELVGEVRDVTRTGGARTARESRRARDGRGVSRGRRE